VPKPLTAIVPDPEVLAAMRPEDAGLVILQHLHGGGAASFHPNNLLMRSGPVAAYPHQWQEVVAATLAEGLAWLEREVLIARRPESFQGEMVISRRGLELVTSLDLSSYMNSQLLLRASLHPALIAEDVDATFARGRYSSAVLLAFKALEVRVRAASGAPATRQAQELMQFAFNKDNGPLALDSPDPSERISLMNFMAGAYGLHRNPNAHRDVGFDDATEAAEIILLASHLLRTVDRIAGRRAGGGQPEEAKRG